MKAREAAKYIISAIKNQMTDISPEEFDVTPLKLQKLLYYCQGYSLALTGKPMFEDEIEAWNLGPVVKEIYHEYRKYSGGIIPYSSIKACDKPNETVSSIINLVLQDKGQYDGKTLARATHRERPYIESFKGAYTNAEIPVELLKEYFTEEILRREEDYEGDDEFWMSQGEPLSKTDLEAVLEEL